VLGSAWAQTPQSAQDHLGEAERLKDHGNWDAALLEYRQAAALAPNDPEIHFSFGIALYRNHLFDQAVQELQLSVRLEPGVVVQDALKNALASQHYFRAVELQRQGDWKAAIAEYQLAIDVDPRNGRVKIPDLATEQCSLAIALRKQGDLAKAQEHLRQAYVLNSEDSQTSACQEIWGALSKDSSTLIARADQLLKDSDPRGAMEKYRVALAMNLSAGDAAHVHLQMARALRTLDDADGAVASVREAAHLQPDAATYGKLADILEWDGKIAESRAAYEEAVRLNPKDAQLHYDFGTMLIDHSELDAGIAEMRATLQLHPHVADLASLAHEGIAVALKAKGDTHGALSELKAALALKPSDDTASSMHCLMAELLKDEGKMAEARREAETADNLDPHDAEGGQGCAANLSGPYQ
jgi:tetratricopeptide (TPR) repeat protein